MIKDIVEKFDCEGIIKELPSFYIILSLYGRYGWLKHSNICKYVGSFSSISDFEKLRGQRELGTDYDLKSGEQLRCKKLI